MTSTHTRSGDVAYRVELGTDTTPTNPSGTGSFVATSTCIGSPVTLRVTVTPGTFPSSTGITVTANTTSLGGAPGTVLFDDGNLALHGDAVAGDNIFSVLASRPATTGTAAVPFNIADAQARTATGSISVDGTTTCFSGTPAAFTDLGVLNPATPASIPTALSITQGEVEWLKFTLASGATAPCKFVDIWTGPSAITDTEIAVYNASGALVASDDDDGSGNFSELSFGDTSPTRTTATGNTGGNGRDGNLAAGTYWVAVSGFNAFFDAANWSVGTTSTATGSVTVNVSVGNDPTGNSITASGANVTGATCNVANLAVNVNTDCATPASTGVSVTADLSAFGLSNAEAFSPTGGGNFSYPLLISGSQAEGAYTVNFTATDAQARTATGTMTVTVDTKGDLPATSGRGTGTGASSTITGFIGTNDVDMIAICVGDPAAFGASVVGGATFDTQLFLFDSTGAAVVMNDDEPDPGTSNRSNITGFTLPAGGAFYLAISGYNNDPRNSANELIWNNTPFDTVRGPDATVTAGTVVDHWDNVSTNTGAYTITLTNATTLCPADLDNGNGEGAPDCGVDINDLLYFLSGFEAGSLSVDLDDGTNTGTKDCGVDINDLLFFLNRFEAGC